MVSVIKLVRNWRTKAELFTTDQRIYELQRALVRNPDSEKTAERQEELRQLYIKKTELEELINEQPTFP